MTGFTNGRLMARAVHDMRLIHTVNMSQTNMKYDTCGASQSSLAIKIPKQLLTSRA